MQTFPLSTLHRALVAFSALALGYGPRAQVLAAQHVTEADLLAHTADWERLLVLRTSQREDRAFTDRNSS